MTVPFGQRKCAALILVLGITTFLLFAQEDEEDVIIVSAERIEQTVDDAVEKTQIVTQEQIRETGAKTLTEALKTLPGVAVSDVGPGNPVTSISMQGLDAAYVKILIDGVAVSGDIEGATATFTIPVEDIDRIEVIQGAGSVLYGSDAMGGAINIITKKTETVEEGLDWHFSVSDELSYSIYKDFRNYAAGSFSLAGKHAAGSVIGSFDFNPGLTKRRWDAMADKVIDYYETPKKRVGYVKGNFDWNDDWGKVGVYVSYTDTQQKSNYTLTGSSPHSIMEYLTKRLDGSVTGELIANDALRFNAFSTAKYFALDTNYEVEAGEDSAKTLHDTNSIDWENDIRGSWILNDWNSFLFGFNANLETIAGKSFDGREWQMLLSLFAQDTIAPGEKKIINVVPGVRLDLSPSVKGSDVMFMATPKLSLRLEPIENIVFRFAYGMGYKTPSLKQKYWVFYHPYGGMGMPAGNFILNGNPNLKSEKSQSFNISYEQSIANIIRVSAGGYFNYLNDMITSVETDSESVPRKRSYINVDKAMTWGVDTAISSNLSRFDFRAGYAYTATRQQNDNGDWVEMAFRSAHRVTAGIGYHIPSLELKVGINGEWNSPQRIRPGADEWTPDYLMFGVTLSRMFFNERLEVYARCDNILNNAHFKKSSDGQNQKEYFGLNAGTTFSVGGRYTF